MFVPVCLCLCVSAREGVLLRVCVCVYVCGHKVVFSFSSVFWSLTNLWLAVNFPIRLKKSQVTSPSQGFSSLEDERRNTQSQLMLNGIAVLLPLFQPYPYNSRLLVLLVCLR